MTDYLKELQMPNRILLGPGPSNVNPRVLQAMMTPILGHLDPDFWHVLDEVREMLSLALGTTTEYTLPLPATGTAGMESAFASGRPAVKMRRTPSRRPSARHAGPRPVAQCAVSSNSTGPRASRARSSSWSRSLPENVSGSRSFFEWTGSNL